MDKDLAGRMIKAALSLKAPLNGLAAVIEEIPDETERRAFRRHWAALAASLYDLTMLIVREHPGLDPDRGSDTASVSSR
jgi:hypothetical protein